MHLTRGCGYFTNCVPYLPYSDKLTKVLDQVQQGMVVGWKTKPDFDIIMLMTSKSQNKALQLWRKQHTMYLFSKTHFECIQNATCIHKFGSVILLHSADPTSQMTGYNELNKFNISQCIYDHPRVYFSTSLLEPSQGGW